MPSRLLRCTPGRRTAAVVTCAAALVAGGFGGAVPASGAPTAPTAPAVPATAAVPGAATAIALAAPVGGVLGTPAARSGNAAAARAAVVGRLAGLPAASLTVSAVRADTTGTDVTYQQVEAGVPVRGAVLVASLDRAGSVVALNGRTSGLVAAAARPATSAANAAGVAVGRASATQAGAYTAAATTVQWYDPAVAGTGTSAPTLVYAVTVLPTGGTSVHGDVLVSAATNTVVADETQSSDALRRCVKDVDSANVSTGSICSYTSATRVEGGGASGITDVDAAYTRFGTASAFYAQVGQDLTALIGYSTSSSGGKYLSAITRACPSAYGCPMQNAFWNGSGMVFGTGFTQADDVITHELTHGVTQFTNHLQNGAMNEAMSDIMGEFEDLGNGSGDDSASVRWLVGEDLPGIGAIRDMSNPPASAESGPHPDRIGSPDFSYTGEVHGMSGPMSKTAYLIADGGSFNGYDVSGIGLAKSQQLWWKVEKTLTQYSGYKSLNTTLASACSSLQSAGTLTAADCRSVTTARAATELTLATR